MSKRLHRGLRTHRLIDNPEEERFAAAWELANKHGDVLNHMLDERAQQGGTVPDAADRDRVVAATVVQWLGTPVGRAFLSDLDYKRVKR